MTPARRIRRAAIAALLLHALFPLSWLVAGGLEPGYSHERQYVSELGAPRYDHRWLYALGAAALGCSWIALGAALRGGLRHGLPSGRWSQLPVRLFLVIGVATTVVAALPPDCAISVDAGCRMRWEAGALSWRHYAHDFIDIAVQLLLAATPFAVAATLRGTLLGRIALSLGVVGLLVATGLITAQVADADRHGIYQRTGLAVVHGWTCLLAASLLLFSEVRSGDRPHHRHAGVCR